MLRLTTVLKGQLTLELTTVPRPAHTRVDFCPKASSYQLTLPPHSQFILKAFTSALLLGTSCPCLMTLRA